MLLFIYRRRHHLLLCCGALLLSLQCLQHTSYAFAPPPSITVSHHFQKRTHSSDLFATDNDKSSSTSKSARERGIYSRPSAAIERGSGFFIPGLEGPRIRILFGMTVLLANGANHLFAESEVGDLGQIVAEVLAAGYGVFLLLQGLIESGVGVANSSKGSAEDLIVESDGDNNDIVVLDSSTAVVSNNNGFSPDIEGDLFAMKSIQRLAQTIVSLTPATHFLLANEEDGILYRYGIGNDGSNSFCNEDDYTTIIKAALDATGSSRAGRVALPSDHPVSKLLPTSATRCILVQSIDGFGSGGKSCLIIGSDKLLPAYTKNDLRWIGQLAVEPNV